MKRKEEMNDAIETYMNGLFEDGVEIPIEDYENISDAFSAGMEYADKHPKSPWINIKEDLPCNHEELLSKTPKIIHSKEVLATKNVLVCLTYGIVKLVSMVYINNKWEWDSIFKDEIVFWLPIPKLPKT